MTVSYEIKDVFESTGIYVVATLDDGSTLGIQVPASRASSAAEVDAFVLERIASQTPPQKATFNVGDTREIQPPEVSPDSKISQIDVLTQAMKDKAGLTDADLVRAREKVVAADVAQAAQISAAP